MSKFKQYRIKQIAELREVTSEDSLPKLMLEEVAISQAYLDAGSPKIGGMIARNPENHAEQWLVSKEDFNYYYEPFHEKENKA